MGYKLVDAAFAFVRAREQRERELEAIEVALLLLMAHRADDQASSPAFWLKRSEICAQLGIRDTDAGRKRVQRALGALAAASAIDPPQKYQRGFTPRYSLIYQGGCSASTPSPEVWTPGIPLEAAKGDAQRPQVWTPGIPSMDAQHPPEEKEQKEEEAARANLTPMPFTLTQPPTPNWDDALPEPRNAQEAARCRRHPTGTSEACGACGENRQTWVHAHRASTQPRRPVPLRHRIEAGRRICDNHDHIPTADGTCRNCEIRADDLAHLIGARA